MSHAAYLASPELKPLRNIYHLPELLEGEWDARYGDNTDPLTKSFTPKIFDSIDYVEHGVGHKTYFGYRQNRQPQPARNLSNIAYIAPGAAEGITQVAAGGTRPAAPEGPAIYVAQTRGIDVVGRANIYLGEAVAGLEPSPYVGFFRDYGENAGSVELDTARLLAMNAACLKFYGQVLHSAPHPSETDPVEAWHELVEVGLAEANPHLEEMREQYSFIAAPAISAA